MAAAKLSDVKNDLSRYVARARRGERIRILVRGVAVAEIGPIEAARERKDDENARLAELVSAIRRRERDGDLDTADVAAALARLEARAGRWTEVNAIDPVRDRAERLLAVHALRAADALQLAAALALFDDRPRGRSFLTRNAELAAAAGREGFSVIVPT